MNNIGRRIVVYGPTGSGKSTMARLIAGRTGLPCVELDRIFWLPDWVEKPREEFRADALATLEKHKDGWVCDGNYNRIRESILPMADTVIWLRLPIRVTFFRVLKRAIYRIVRRELIWGTNRETVGKQFFSRDSLLLYSWNNRNRYHIREGKALKELPHRARIIELGSPGEVKRFLRGQGWD